jgi:hypothetical protein
MPANPTFADIWHRYRTLKEPSWSTPTRKAVVSVFETAPPKEGPEGRRRRPSILQMIGSPSVIRLTPAPIQQMLNNMATSGYSYSAEKKARTYMAAALEYPMGERIIPTNPAVRVQRLVPNSANPQSTHTHTRRDAPLVVRCTVPYRCANT